MLSGTLLLFLVPNVMTLFTIVSTLAAIMVVFSWGMILVAYLVYRHKRLLNLHYDFRPGYAAGADGLAAVVYRAMVLLESETEARRATGIG